MSWKCTDELSVTFQSSVSGAGEFGLSAYSKSLFLNHDLGSIALLFHFDKVLALSKCDFWT